MSEPHVAVPSRPPGSGPEAPYERDEPEVVAVIADVDDLAGRPVAEHVAVFEAAHERLRRLLSGESRAPDAGR